MAEVAEAGAFLRGLAASLARLDQLCELARELPPDQRRRRLRDLHVLRWIALRVRDEVGGCEHVGQ
jgi:hypothetical protein